MAIEWLPSALFAAVVGLLISLVVLLPDIVEFRRAHQAGPGLREPARDAVIQGR